MSLSQARLLRCRKMPQRFKTDDATAHFPAMVEAHYCQIYFKVQDYAFSTIKARFDQPRYEIYRQAEDLLMNTIHGQDASNELATVTDFYGNDFDQHCLSSQMTSLAAKFDSQRELHLHDILTYLRSFSSSERAIFSEVVMLLKIILVNTATNSISESLFSDMCRLKTYLHSTMGQSRLNAVMLLHVHKEMTDQLSLIKSANMFASTEHRMAVFGTFSENNLQAFFTFREL